MKHLFVLLLIASLAGCGGEENTKQASEENTAKEETMVREEPFFPVTSFIAGQIHIVDSTQALTMGYITNGKKKDSAMISIKEFDRLTKEFLQPDFNDSTVRKYYKENSFADQSMNGVVLNYTSTKPELEIQRVDVVVDANAVMNDKVRSIYMEKQLQVRDTFIYKKLYWRADKSFQIITTKRVDKNPEIVHIIKVEWN